ncbi:hypothetical protein AVEN_104929-1 [Araneus ventricosus]|uniref:Uncharacterized protein n=1 Tax=Araneus ventricosus TaxID=182803 RepID=A0A4Y2PXN6_ARAVE|nr:hypothetical protein AVEN_104929-1 [Araneus ventricosus]
MSLNLSDEQTIVNQITSATKFAVFSENQPTYDIFPRRNLKAPCQNYVALPTSGTALVQTPICLATSPKKISRLKSNSKTIGQQTTHVRESSRSFFFTDEEKKGQTPHAKFPENQRAKGSYFLYPFSGEKKMVKRRNVFS